MSKRIEISPSLLKVSNSKTKKKAPKPIIQPSALQKQLMERIKRHQNEEMKRSKHNPTHQQAPSDDFEENMNFLTERLNKRQQTKSTQDKETDLHEEQEKAIFPDPPINLELPDDLLPTTDPQINNGEMNKTEPPYGNLKNGTKPSYRQWFNGTRKRSNPDMTNHIVTEQEPFKCKENFVKARRKTHHVKTGKNKETRTVGILISDSKTRRCNGQRIKRMRSTNIDTIKKYLKERHLIKSGTKAPHEILRKTYEAASMSGNVENTGLGLGGENLVHNFLNET